MNRDTVYSDAVDAFGAWFRVASKAHNWRGDKGDEYKELLALEDELWAEFKDICNQLLGEHHG